MGPVMDHQAAYGGQGGLPTQTSLGRGGYPSMDANGKAVYRNRQEEMRDPDFHRPRWVPKACPSPRRGLLCGKILSRASLVHGHAVCQGQPSASSSLLQDGSASARHAPCRVRPLPGVAPRRFLWRGGRLCPQIYCLSRHAVRVCRSLRLSCHARRCCCNLLRELAYQCLIVPRFLQVVGGDRQVGLN